jgi:hypothetical protein
MIRNPHTILNSNPRGLGCIVSGNIDSRSRENRKKPEKKCKMLKTFF